MARSTPALVELLQLAVEASLYELHTSCPGQITAIHTDGSSLRQFADVRPTLRRVLPVDPDEGLEPPYAEEVLPVISRVPIAFPQGGGFAISWPLSVGDFVLLVFAERSIDQWLAVAQKGQQTTVSTGDLGTHTLDGAVALPLGPAPMRSLLQSVAADALVIGSDAGKRIAIRANGIALGSPSATNGVARADLVDDELDATKSDIDTLITAIDAAFQTIDTALGTTLSEVFTGAVSSIPHEPSSVASTVVTTD